MTRPLPALILIAAVFGCTPDAETGTEAPLTSIAQIDLQVGSLDGDGADVFSRITGIAEDADGRILVADYQTSEIRVFSPEGEPLFKFGRDGSGPGEFRGPCCIAWDPTGLLWVRDGGNNRYSAFNVSPAGAEFVTAVPMAHSDVNYLAPVTFSPEGHLVDVGHSRLDPQTRADPPVVRHTLGPGGEILGTASIPNPDPDDIGMVMFEQELPNGFSRRFIYQPFAPSHLIAHGPRGEWATGLGSSYSIDWFRPGDTIRIEGVAEAPLISAKEKAEGEQRLADMVAGAGRSMSEIPFGVPDRKPPLRAIFFDATGRLWVQLNRAEGELAMADIWSPAGVLERRVQWPEEVVLRTPAWIGESSALGVRTDSLGVQSVVRLQF